MSDKIIVSTLKGELTERIPFWFMRQAGRYLPEYREVRKDFSNFLEFCYTPDAATKVTLQPIDRFGMDAAILFSDILVIPDALGQPVKFVKGEGPKLEALADKKAIEALSSTRVLEHLQPVFQAIKNIRGDLAADKALIGFAGAPWTLACYMLEGSGSREYQIARGFAAANPKAFKQLMDTLVKAIIDYACQKIKSGIDVFQLFDSWAGVVPSAQFGEWVVEPTRRIVEGIKAKYPNVPIIGFAKGAGVNLSTYALATGVDAIGVDQQQPLEPIKALGKVLQGNLDNVTLASSKEAALSHSQAILDSWQDVPFIFNLGHGFLPHTPIEHVEAVVELVKGFRRDV